MTTSPIGEKESLEAKKIEEQKIAPIEVF